MDECLVRQVKADGTPVLPVAYLVCNQSPPVGDTPSLMTFQEVETLFHEFGHGLHHMLTTVERPQAAGINNVEWDAVELPSQFMENWCYDRATLLGMARHWQTGAPLPETEFAKLQAARTFMGGAARSRRTPFSAASATSSPVDIRRAITPTSGQRCSVPTPSAPLRRWVWTTKT
jgi:oligopeptidase A